MLGPGLELPLVVLCDESLNVCQLAVQVLAASLLSAVVGIGLFDFPVFLKNLPTGCLGENTKINDVPLGEVTS